MARRGLSRMSVNSPTTIATSPSNAGTLSAIRIPMSPASPAVANPGTRRASAPNTPTRTGMYEKSCRYAAPKGRSVARWWAHRAYWSKSPRRT